MNIVNANTLRFRELHAKLNLSVAAMARLTSHTRRTIERWTNGESYPTELELAQLEHLAHCQRMLAAAKKKDA